MANDSNIKISTRKLQQAFEQAWWGHLPGEKKDGMFVGVDTQIETKQPDAFTARKAAYNLSVLFEKADGNPFGEHGLSTKEKVIDAYSIYLKSSETKITSEADRLALKKFQDFMEETKDHLAEYGRNEFAPVRKVVQNKISTKVVESNILIQKKLEEYKQLLSRDASLQALQKSIEENNEALEKLLGKSHLSTEELASTEKLKAKIIQDNEKLAVGVQKLIAEEAEKQKKAAQQQDLRPIIAELKEFRGKIQYADDSYIRQLRSGANFADDKKYSSAAQAHLKQVYDQVQPKVVEPVTKRSLVSTVFHTVVNVATQGVTMAVTKGSSMVAPYLGTPDLEKNADNQFKRILGSALDDRITELTIQARQQYRSRVESDTAEFMKVVKEPPAKASWFQRARQFVTNGWNSVKKIFELRTLDKLVNDLKSTPTHKFTYDILQKFLSEAERVKKWLKDDDYRTSIVKAAERLSESADKIFQNAAKQKQFSSTSQAQALLSAPVATPSVDNQNLIENAQNAAAQAQRAAQQARVLVANRSAKTAPARLFSGSTAVEKQKSVCTAVPAATLRHAR